MASPLNRVIQHVLADVGQDGAGMTDGELLTRYESSRDGDALAALVRRHAPMVWGVCLRLLNQHDAEDAFQAAFLVLVRRARDVPRQAVASWMYGVARKTAVRLRATNAKRGRRESQVVTMPEPTAEASDADLPRVLDEELSRLPGRYRSVVVLCDLEGMTRKEAAGQLGIPEGSVASRLARARAMLAKRLTRRGVASVAVLAAAAPPALVASTIQAAAGKPAAVSARVAALVEGMVTAMFVTRIKNVLAMVLVVVALAGAAGIIYRTNAAEQPQAKKEPPAAKKDQKPVMTKEEKLQLLTDQVLAAHGGDDTLKKLQFTMTVKHSNGNTIKYFVQPPKQFRLEIQHRDSTTKRICILFPRGKMWWKKNPNEAAVPVIYSGLQLPIESSIDHYVNFFGPRQVLRLKDADHKVALLDDEAKIGDRAAVGVEVTSRWFKGKMYFDKVTHLLVKSPVPSFLAGQGAVTYSDYKKFDGIPIPLREHDGYLDPQVTDFQAVDKFDAKLFEQP
jgi:RNA polymerase sigma factor (sigma-70 family)